MTPAELRTAELRTAVRRTAVRRGAGCGPQDHLPGIRPSRAKELLATTELPVAAVARRVGYDDPACFCRLFTRRLATAPSASAPSGAVPSPAAGATSSPTPTIHP